MIEKHMSIIVGDANGTDKAMQGYLAEREYKNVLVYFVGADCRNNIGSWVTSNVSVDPKLSGRDFYAQKDKQMAMLADLGLVLWDGKSAGSVHNVLELLKHGKKAVVYYGPDKHFYNVASLEDAKSLLRNGDPRNLKSIKNKFGIEKSLKELELGKQITLGLF